MIHPARQRYQALQPWQRTALVAGVVFAAGFVVLAILQRQITDIAFGDDVYVFFNYAENLADGNGWRYQATDPDPSMRSSPLYTGVLALAYLVDGRMELNATLVFMASLAGAAALTAVTLRKLGFAAAGYAAAAFLVVSPWLIAQRGMETVPMLALVAATVAATVHGRVLLAGLLAGLTVITRGDAILFAAIVGAVLVWDHRRIPWRYVLGGLAVGIPWGIAGWIFVGTPIPETLEGKMVQGQEGYFGPGSVYLRGVNDVAEYIYGFETWLYALVGLAAVGAVVAVVRWRELWRYLVPVVGFAAAHHLMYGLILRVPSYPWYYVPQLAALAVLAGLAVGEAVALVRRHQLVPRLAGGAVAVLAAVTLWLGATDVFTGWRFYNYAGAAEWVNENTPEDSTVAITEFGLFGWEVERPIVEYVGLLSDESVDDLRNHDLVAWIERNEPEYWVVHEPPWLLWETEALNQPWFLQAYRAVHEIGPGRDIQTVRIYERYRTIEEAKALVGDEATNPAPAGGVPQAPGGAA